MSLTRRAVLQAGCLWAAAMGAAARAVVLPAGRRIALLNLHTGEKLSTEYSRDGAYLPEALSAIAQVLRDVRSGETHPIDPKLMDYLCEVARLCGAQPHFEVISGYRSPQTNERLRAQSGGVSQHSLHMRGQAIDVRLAGIECARLADLAVGLERGGVGYYRASNFVHLDTGAFRTWKG